MNYNWNIACILDITRMKIPFSNNKNCKKTTTKLSEHYMVHIKEII